MARGIPEVLDLGLEEAENVSPKFWARSWGASRGSRKFPGRGWHFPKSGRVLGAPLLTRMGTPFLLNIRPPGLGRMGWGFAPTRNWGSWAPGGVGASSGSPAGWRRPRHMTSW